jgi:hypothetical protein
MTVREGLAFLELSFYIAISKYCMKKLILSLALLPFAKMGPPGPVEIRSGKWPMSFESQGNAHLLIFRDQQILMDEVYDTVMYVNRRQLVDLDSALSILKRGHDGDEATFSNYSLKRANKKYDGMWYILRTKYSSTNFRQVEADVIVRTIRSF